MVLRFLELLIVLPVQVSSFSKSDCLDFIANEERLQFTWSQSTGLSGLGQCNAGVLSQAAIEAKNRTVLQFKTAFNLIWSALPNYQRKPLTTLWKTTSSDCKCVCHKRWNMIVKIIMW